MKPILRSALPYLAALALFVVTPAFAHDAAPGAAPTSTVALDPGLGSLHHPVSTHDRQAQARSQLHCLGYVRLVVGATGALDFHVEAMRED